MDTKRTPGFRDNSLPGTYHRSAGLCFCVQELRLAKYLLAQQWTQLSAVGRAKLLPDSKVGEGEGEALATRSSTEGTGTLGLGEQGRGRCPVNPEGSPRIRTSGMPSAWQWS